MGLEDFGAKVGFFPDFYHKISIYIICFQRCVKIKGT